jgi:hypothetical protein
MMNAAEFLTQMKTILAEERLALRKLDVKGVTEAGARKEALLKAVMTAPESERKSLAAALMEVKGELRRNLVLLAHARDYLRDAITLCTQNKQAARPRLQASL